MESWDDLAPYSRLVMTGKILPRRYQIDIIKSVYIGNNTLVVLPTGLGKTLIAIFAIAKALSEGKKAIMLAPTKPLSEQHYNSLLGLLNIDAGMITLLTGKTSSKKRKEILETAKVVAATPQTIANDLRSGNISLGDFGIVVFDECHRAVGRYAYTYIANECKVRGVPIVGLTASPGSNRKRISELITALGIERIEVRSSTDPDVEKYVFGKQTDVIRIAPGDTISGIMSKLLPLINQHLDNLYRHGLSPFRNAENMPKGRLLEIGNNIGKIQASGYKYTALFDYVYVLNLSHAYELVSTEGLYPFLKYIESLELRSDKSRGVKSMLANPSVVAAISDAKAAEASGKEHPKMGELARLLKGELSGSTVIIFVQYRSAIDRIVRLLLDAGIGARAFVGKKYGMSAGDQGSAIADFRAGKFRVLVATSIGEEGLDIPSVDAVVFYEPVPNEIRDIQRRGRAGRVDFGRVIILVAKGTRDERYLLISRMKERRMTEELLMFKRRMEHYGRAEPAQRQRML